MSKKNISSANASPSLCELTYVNSQEVSCDGGKSFGHPLVYLHIKNEIVTCPYCSKSFTTNHKLHSFAANKNKSKNNE